MTQISTAPDLTEMRAVRAVLDAMSRSEPLRRGYVLKGGLALQLAFGSHRRSGDLDLNAVEPVANEITDETARRLLQFCAAMNAELSAVCARHDFSRLSTQSEMLSKEIPTLVAEVGYRSLDGDDGAVKLQVTLSEIICDTDFRETDGISMHVAALEDIMAEKLKALLQQISRDKVRSSDVFDLWYFTTKSPESVDPAIVTQYLLEKCKQWHDMPRLAKSQFRRKSVIERAAAEYQSLAPLIPDSAEFVPFRRAYECILSFVDRLGLPQ